MSKKIRPIRTADYKAGPIWFINMTIWIQRAVALAFILIVAYAVFK